MAFDKTPSEHIAGITVTGGNLVIPLASIPELVESEITGTNADIRKIAYGLLLKLHKVFVSMADEDKPKKWTSVRNTQAPEDSATATRSFNMVFSINNPLNEVAETEVVSEE